jgi:2-phosphosulfolactate phosphatase
VNQSAFGVRFEWGEQGARALAASTDVIVIVDVLSFSTAVDVAVSRGARVLPFPSRDRHAAEAFAEQERALIAVGRRHTSTTRPYSLSPASLSGLPEGAKLVLPSPNGSTISRIAAEHGCTLLAGCLRNASVVASAARECGATIGVIAAGERWPDGSLRPAIEDLFGAGAIIAGLHGRDLSPEAEVAATAFAHSGDLQHALAECVSGRELNALGFAEDVACATELDVSRTVPLFADGAYTRAV